MILCVAQVRWSWRRTSSRTAAGHRAGNLSAFCRLLIQLVYRVFLDRSFKCLAIIEPLLVCNTRISDSMAKPWGLNHNLNLITCLLPPTWLSQQCTLWGSVAYGLPHADCWPKCANFQTQALLQNTDLTQRRWRLIFLPDCSTVYMPEYAAENHRKRVKHTDSKKKKKY